ncbi:MAG TPA: PilN domain-containing protein [Burkholderiaceae bacterium]|nr:PilN domain-containing protein [Burkholderiaceae bacterium]
MIDLIPDSFRQTRRLRRQLRLFALAVAGLLLAVAAARIAVAHRIDAVLPASVQLRQLQSQIASERARIERLRADRDEASEQLRLLAMLKGRDVAASVAVAIDEALDERVWLNSLKLARQLELPDAKAQRAVPSDAGTAAIAKVRQSVELSGHATDHAALTEFLGRLGSVRAFDEIRLLSTATRSGPGGIAVEFSAVAALGALP